MEVILDLPLQLRQSVTLEALPAPPLPRSPLKFWGVKMKVESVCVCVVRMYWKEQEFGSQLHI